MQLANSTPWHAMLFRGMKGGPKMFGSLACRINFDLAGTELIPAANQIWRISPGPWESPKGPFPPDEVFYRGGVDVFVFGSARAPNDRPVSRMEVSVEIGPKFKHRIAVIGDRVWEKKGKGKYQPTEPKPFKSMPLTMQNAFGGVDVWDELPMPFALNPEGKGYRQFEELTPGTPLPNIEHPDKPIREWTDHPEPVGVCAPPPLFQVKTKFVEFDPKDGKMLRIDPKFFNTAFPDMIAPSVKPGDQVRVNGVRPNGPLRFVVPPTPVRARVRLEDYAHETLMPIDQIGIDVETDQVFITYRFPFHYQMVPLEKRSCELEPA